MRTFVTRRALIPVVAFVLAGIQPLAGVAAAHAAEKLRVVYFNYPPYVVVDSKPGAERAKPRGAVIDVWEKHVAPAANVEIEWVGPRAFFRALEMLKAGEVDAISHVARNPERDAAFQFPKAPLYEGPQGLLVRKSEPLNAIRSIDEIAGKHIGMLGAGTLPPFLEHNRGKVRLEGVVDGESPAINIRRLLDGQLWGVYFYFADVLLYYASAEHKLDQVKVVPFPGGEKDALVYGALSRKLDPAVAKRLGDAMETAFKKVDRRAIIDRYISQVAK